MLNAMITNCRTPLLLLLLLASLVASGFAGCHRGSTNESNPNNQSSSTNAASQSTPQSQFERDLQFIRNGQFTYVWVFSRKDGKALDKEDGDFLRKNAPQVVDWATTDGGKKVIAGTNFDLELGNLELLKKRFVAENYSGK